MMNEEKQKALEAALGQIEKHYGKGSVMKLGDSSSSMVVEAVPTGSLGLDIAPLRCVGLLLSFPSSRSFNSIVALNNRKKPPNSMIKSRALKVNERKLNSG